MRALKDEWNFSSTLIAMLPAVLIGFAVSSFLLAAVFEEIFPDYFAYIGVSLAIVSTAFLTAGGVYFIISQNRQTLRILRADIFCQIDTLQSQHLLSIYFQSITENKHGPQRVSYLCHTTEECPISNGTSIMPVVGLKMFVEPMLDNDLAYCPVSIDDIHTLKATLDYQNYLVDKKDLSSEKREQIISLFAYISAYISCYNQLDRYKRIIGEPPMEEIYDLVLERYHRACGVPLQTSAVSSNGSVSRDDDA